MATQNLSEDYGNGPVGRPNEWRTTRVNGHRRLGHRYTALKLKRMKDHNKLCLLTDHLANFVPKTVKRLISANPEQPALSKHEQDVSVLFVDICDYTRLSESLSLRALNRLVEQYFSTFLNRIHEADGDINEIAGDGFMAIFQDTDPQKHALKAADTSLALIDATTALNRHNRRQPLAVHMGLNSGLALVGVTRFEGLYESRWTFTASGPMTNLAARLACIAKPAQILVGPESVARLGRHYDVRKLMRTHLKNMTNPIDIYRLVGARHSFSPSG